MKPNHEVCAGGVQIERNIAVFDAISNIDGSFVQFVLVAMISSKIDRVPVTRMDVLRVLFLDQKRANLAIDNVIPECRCGGVKAIDIPLDNT